MGPGRSRALRMRVSLIQDTPTSTTCLSSCEEARGAGTGYGRRAAAWRPWGTARRRDLRSAGEAAAGDVDGETGQPAGGVGRQEECDLGDVVGGTQPPQRMHGGDLLL